jgi:hypothetical protein
MKEFIKFIETNSEKWIFTICILIAGIVTLIDFATGKEIRFPILYVLPVGLAAFRNMKTAAYALAFALSLARMAFHTPWHIPETWPVAAMNALIYMLTLVFYAYLIDRIALQRKALLARVNMLEGILPICASCKKIRNENGQYEQIEKYISEHSPATFSHGVCPECMQKLYPWHMNEAKKPNSGRE